MRDHQDTIFAMSSPPGRSALSIIRISGKKSFWAVKKLTKNKIETFKHRSSLPANIYNKNNNLLDKVVFVFYCAPASYTGENIVEVSTHGNPIIVDRVFNALAALGLRLANPGEFTSRAYHNKKIDLVQAEATLSVINSRSKMGVQSSLLGVFGKLSTKLEDIKKLLILSLGELEYELDISETDNKNKTVARAEKNIKLSIAEMEKLIKTHDKSTMLNEGAKIVIMGAPNVGKSTLLNTLINENRAIVTNTPGTTRDTIKSLTYFSNYPVLLTDTAGIRKTNNQIESLGIEKTNQEILSSDIIFNIQSNIASENKKTDQSKTINIFNKSDLMTNKMIKTLQTNDPNCVVISAKNKSGIDELKTKTEKMLKTKTVTTEPFFLSSKRQQTALIKSKKHLREALGDQSLNELEIIAHNIRLALGEFDWVLGKTTPDDILNSVFSDFCVGK